MLMQSVAISETPSAKASTRSNGTGPGEGPMGPGWIVAVALYLVVLSVLILYLLLKIWPYPTPSGEPKENGQAPAATATTTNGTTAPAPQPGQSGATAATGSSAPAGQQAATTNASTANTAAPTTGTGTAATTAQPPASATSRSELLPPPKKQLPDPETISFFGGRFKPQVYLETRLLLLVMLSGALGSLMHALRSLYWYTGNRKMVWSWVAFYMLLPFTGAMLAVIFYLVVRGGFFSPQASTETTSPFGFAALSALVGLFSPQATLKLKEVAETIFTKPAAGADHKPQESEDAGADTTTPTISLVTPPSGASAGAAKVIIAGTGFVAGLEVKFGGLPAEVISSSSTTIEVVTPENVAGPASVDVVVTNPGGKTTTLSNGYTYLAGGGEAILTAPAITEKPVAGEGGDEDLIDGCDVELKADTPDEDLPITEGGVK